MITITTIKRWFRRHPKSASWAWFILLWIAGVMAVVLLSLPVKLLIRGIVIT